MKRSELEGYVGKVVALDMLNRERPVCRITEITDDGYVVIKDPVIYVPVPTAAGMQVQGIAYAGPLFEVKKLRVAFEHIVAILDVPAQMEQAYIRHASGLVTEAKPKIIVP
jgi:hypothetical protein